MSWPRFKAATALRLLQEGRLTLLDGSGVRNDQNHRVTWNWVDGRVAVVSPGLSLDRAVDLYVGELAVMSAMNSTRNG